MPNFDVVIPVGTTDVNFISRVVNYISTCLKDIEYIYIITSDKNIQSVKKQLLSKFNNCIIIDENKLLPNFSFQ